MKTCLYNARIYPNDKEYVYGSLLIEDNKIAGIYDVQEQVEADKHIDCHNNIIIPGLIDVHLHGSYGYDFINTPQESVNKVAAGLVKEGTTSFMASLTVVSHEDTCALLKDYHNVKQPSKAANFLGVHAEGPYLAIEYKALMDERYLRDPSEAELEDMLKSANGIMKIMTIAPERKNMESFIPLLIENKITPMIGHSGATSIQASKALDLGAKGFTHLYNAMSSHSHRAPGNVTCAFLRDDSFCELIVDGFHVNKEVVQATFKIIGSDRLVLITDAMLGKGMNDGDYIFLT